MGHGVRVGAPPGPKCPVSQGRGLKCLIPVAHQTLPVPVPGLTGDSVKPWTQPLPSEDRLVTWLFAVHGAVLGGGSPDSGWAETGSLAHLTPPGGWNLAQEGEGSERLREVGGCLRPAGSPLLAE